MPDREVQPAFSGQLSVSYKQKNRSVLKDGGYTFEIFLRFTMVGSPVNPSVDGLYTIDPGSKDKYDSLSMVHQIFRHFIF
jgi:hypothetical protein